MRRAPLAALAAAFTLLAFGPAPAQEKQDKPAERIELKLASWFGAGHPHTKNVLVPWSRLVEQRSGGRIKITIAPDGALGPPADTWNMIRTGTLDIGWWTQNIVTGRFSLTAG